MSRIDTRVRTAILCAVNTLLPVARTGRPRVDPSAVLERMALLLWSGGPWRTLGAGYTTVFQAFTKWTAAGVFERAYAAVLRLERRPLKRNVRVECIDSSYVKSIYGRDCIGRNPTDRGRNATKVSAIVASDGVPVALAFFPGNTSDQRTVEVTLCSRLAPRAAPGMPMYADKGYDSAANRALLRRYGYVDCISARGRRTHRVVNRRRNVVERTFSWLDKSRRLLLRYDQKVSAYIAWTYLACLRMVGARLV
jgi:putative transposase